MGGLHPFVSVYSTFLQRAYDQISHDLCRMNLPVVVGVDRAGLVGDDGDTHQGIYDIGYLRSIPNTIVCQPKDGREAQDLLYTGFKTQKPFFIRYPRGNEVYIPNEEYTQIPIEAGQKLSLKSRTDCHYLWTGCQTDYQEGKKQQYESACRKCPFL